MTGFPGQGPWPAIRRDLNKPNRKPVIAVVGYIGGDAPVVMPLRAGDTLVCDGSALAVRSRLTSASALATYRKQGVSVFSVDGLHAKLIAAPTYAWVGSANASLNSESNLIEASIRVTGPQAAKVRAWAKQQATVDRELTAADIRTLAKLKLAPFRAGPRKRELPAEVPGNLTLLRFMSTGEELTASEDRAVEADRSKAKTAAIANGQPSALDYILQPDGSTVKVGHWVVEVRNGRVRHPAQVVRVTRSAVGAVVWMSQVRTTARPNIKQLRQLLPSLEPDFGEIVVRKPEKVAALIGLFG